MSTLSAQEVAARLGVKIDSVYAYVSRGVLTARREPGSRRSLFDSDEVDTLARRGRPRRSTRPSVLDLVVETELTTIVDQKVRYRGRDACAMARTETFERVAVWLWSGAEDESDLPWQPRAMILPELASPRDRLRFAVVMASATEPTLRNLSTPVVIANARVLLASMASAVPPESEARDAGRALDLDRDSPQGSIAERLWSRLASVGPTPELVGTLNAALVLLADHELASSTVAARVAASVRADPYSVVLAGLGALAGTLHGSASGLVHQLIADSAARGPERALSAALERHGHLPGFGHPLYPDGDPRAATLLGMIDAASSDASGLRVIHALADAARRHSRTTPNVDYALGALSTVAKMPASAGETVFTIARTAGWIAHAIEEYAEPPLRFRARAVPRGTPHG